MKIAHVSAGGVVVSTEGKVLALHRFPTENWQYDSWHLPKGTQLPNESLEDTALREIQEETGYRAKIIKFLGTLTSTYERNGRLVNKETHYFLMEPLAEVAAHDPEHDEVEWVDFEFAREKLAEFPIWEKEEEILEVAEKSL
jgi:8-oxo-dGTP pyrophosphatase MutT (NUDIX family)